MPAMLPLPCPRRAPAPAAALVALLAALVSPAAHAEPPLLPSQAFRAVPACDPIDPFAEPDPERGAAATRDCGRDRPLTMAVRTPRLRPTDTGPSAVELDLDKQFSVRHGPFTASARMDLRAASQPNELRLLPQRGVLAAAGTLRLGRDLALDLGLGRDLATTPRTRATATAVYRPEAGQVMYLRLAAEADGALSPAVGLRWMLRPLNAALDLSARRSADDGIEPRVGLRWSP